ncbi:MAG: PD-(D/E)XK nuclease-like domain-containing protein [Rhodocyclaceae bacterium]|nr:PD-(D/E)XK nuclease-like domain-containing protein [Rhodocyclaceae bacterium]
MAQNFLRVKFFCGGDPGSVFLTHVFIPFEAYAVTAVLPVPTKPSLLDIFGNGPYSKLGISHEDYHADRSCVSVSSLKEMLRSPAHYRAYLDIGRKETPSLMFGTAAHVRLLEPQDFAQRYVVAPPGDRRTKAYKDFEAANAGKAILTADEAAAIERIAANVDAHQGAAALLRRGLKEVTLIWQDAETGIWIKARPDCLAISLDTGVCLDLKTTEDASPNAFVRACASYSYDLQAAVYLDGLREVFGRDFDFCFLPAEKSEPHGVALYGAPEDMLESGRRKFRRALRQLAECRQTNTWPSYQPEGDYEVLEWPRWAR